MPIQFMTSPKYLLTSESVTEGHPDKLCDQISDAVLDAALRGDPMSRVACETVATKNLIMVTGEITTKSDLNFDDIARGVMRQIGYTDVSYGIDGNSCGVIAQRQPAVARHQQRRNHGLGRTGRIRLRRPPGYRRRRPRHDGRLRLRRDRWIDAHYR